MRLSKWFALGKKDVDAARHADSVDASREGTAKPLSATGSELADDGSMTGTSIPIRHDDGSFSFPHQLRHRRSSGDDAPAPPGGGFSIGKLP
jgi:hypothetical protein